MAIDPENTCDLTIGAKTGKTEAAGEAVPRRLVHYLPPQVPLLCGLPYTGHARWFNLPAPAVVLPSFGSRAKAPPPLNLPSIASGPR